MNGRNRPSALAWIVEQQRWERRLRELETWAVEAERGTSSPRTRPASWSCHERCGRFRWRRPGEGSAADSNRIWPSLVRGVAPSHESVSVAVYPSSGASTACCSVVLQRLVVHRVHGIHAFPASG